LSFINITGCLPNLTIFEELNGNIEALPALMEFTFTAATLGGIK